MSEALDYGYELDTKAEPRPVQESPLPDIVVDYLDLLLQDVTEPAEVAVPVAAGAGRNWAGDLAFEQAFAQVLAATEDAALAAPEVVADDVDLAIQALFAAAPEPDMVVPKALVADSAVDTAIDTAIDTVVPDLPNTTVAPPYTEAFSCLQAQVGDYLLLVPLLQVRRVELVVSYRRFQGICLPGLPARDYLLLIDSDGPGIYVDGIEGVVRVDPDDVLWRQAGHSSPWYTGTHKTLLCRIFDPILFLQQTRI